jgi:hypothetical protein
LAHRIPRIKLKNQGSRKATSPETEPNFYLYPPLPEESSSLKKYHLQSDLAQSALPSDASFGANFDTSTMPFTSHGSSSNVLHPSDGVSMSSLLSLQHHQQAKAPLISSDLLPSAHYASQSLPIENPSLAAQLLAYNQREQAMRNSNAHSFLNYGLSNNYNNLFSQHQFGGLAANQSFLDSSLLPRPTMADFLPPELAALKMAMASQEGYTGGGGTVPNVGMPPDHATQYFDGSSGSGSLVYGNSLASMMYPPPSSTSLPTPLKDDGNVGNQSLDREN